MAMLTLKETKVLPLGDYPARVASITETSGTYGDQYLFEFELRLRDGSTANLRSWVSQKYSSGAKQSKLYGYASALCNGAPPRQFDPMVELLNKMAVASVVIETKPDGTQYNRIHSLRPMPTRQAPAPKPAPPPPPPDDDDAFWDNVYSEDEQDTAN